MSNYIVNDTDLTAIATAIRTKGGTSNQLSFPSGFESAITAIPTGGTFVVLDDVNFYDYDGTLVASYSAADFANLSAMPQNPSHTGLTAQGWNWSLADAKTYVASYGKLNIGQMYITDDGKTRLYIHIADSHRMDVPVYWYQFVSDSDGVTIDWGDNSATETFAGSGNKNTTHTYSAIGSYVITFDPANGCSFRFGGNGNHSCIDNTQKVYSNMLVKVELGKQVSEIGGSAFYQCYSLSNITIPSGVTSLGGSAFCNCYSLASIIMPSGVTSIGTSVFEGCYSLSNIIIPSGVTSIGSSAFSYCYSLSNIIIPSGVTTIGGSAFYYCYSLSNITIPSGVTSIGGSAFCSCYSLSNIIIPSGVTTIGNYMFSSCYSLASIIIPSVVTSIGSSAFKSCYPLASITIPSGVTSIGDSAFSGCSVMAVYDFSACTAVPTLANTNAFSGIPSDCKMLIPSSLYSTWSTADKWSTYASYMVSV